MSGKDLTTAQTPDALVRRTDAEATAREQGSGDDPALLPGARVGNYTVARLVERGGCGAVYEARHEVLGRRVAIKVLQSQLTNSVEMVTRFMREAQAVNTIGHPHIVDIFEFDRLPDGRPYHVMEFVEGVGLSRYVAERGRLSGQESVEILTPVCEAVAAAHARGIFHRDLKPSNVIVGVQEGRPLVKLIDFGIAKLSETRPGEPSLTSFGRKLGTPISMAPEQVRGLPIDQRADIYALGVILFYMLTARYPFDAADPVELELMHLKAMPPRPSQFAPVSTAFDSIVLRCLEKRPEDRFTSVNDLLGALKEAIRTRRSVAPLVGRPAVGILVSVASVTGEPISDEGDAMEDAIEVLASTQELLSEGFAFPLQGNTMVLGVHVLPESEDEARQTRNRAVMQARELATKLSKRPYASAENRVEVSVQSDNVLERMTPRGTMIVGGPLLSVDQWRGHEAVPGVYIAPNLRDTTSIDG